MKFTTAFFNPTKIRVLKLEFEGSNFPLPSFYSSLLRDVI